MSRRLVHARFDPLSDHTRQIPRLRRIEGQIRGLQQMIRNKRPCLEIIYQASSAVAGIRRVQADMLKEHLTACSEMAVTGKLPKSECQRVAEDIARLLKGFR